jgi:hypothetical protein
MTTMTCTNPCAPGAPVYYLQSLDPPAQPYTVHESTTYHVSGWIIVLLIVVLCATGVVFKVLQLTMAARRSIRRSRHPLLSAALSGLFILALCVLRRVI